MAIKAEQLSGALKQSPRSILLTGEEPLLMLEAQDTVRSSLKQSGFIERSVYEVTRNFDFNQLTAEADNLSLFAERKLIELRFDKLPDKAQQEALKSLLESRDDDTCYLVSCPKMDKRKLSAKWVKAFEAQGIVVQIWPIPSYQLPRWLEQRAKKVGLILTPDAIQLLADRSEGNLLAAKQDLDKLVLLADAQSIGVEQVLDAVANNARYNIFELIDTALSGNAAKVARMLDQIRSEGVVPVIIVATLYREVRQLMKMSEQVNAGKSVADVVREYRVWSSRTRLVSQALNRLPVKVWQRLVGRCAHLDKLSKGQTSGNVWDELMTCLLLMGGKQLWRKVV